MAKTPRKAKPLAAKKAAVAEQFAEADAKAQPKELSEAEFEALQVRRGIGGF